MKNNDTWYYDNNIDFSGDKAILYLNELYGTFRLFPSRAFVENAGESWDQALEYIKNILNQHNGKLYYSYISSEKVTTNCAEFSGDGYTIEPYGDLVNLCSAMCRESLYNCPNDEIDMTAQHAYYEERWT